MANVARPGLRRRAAAAAAAADTLIRRTEARMRGTDRDPTDVGHL